MLNGSLNPWLVCFTLVGFDIDKGQVVEVCVPDSALSDAHLETLSFHAMPDSAAVGTGREDVFYSFCVNWPVTASNQGGTAASVPNREMVSQTEDSSERSSEQVDRGCVATEENPSHVVDAGYMRPPQSLLLAHTLFRQGPDKSSPRGSFQKSLVLVTTLPNVTLPKFLLSTLADLAFVYGRPALERAFREISLWPSARFLDSSAVPSVTYLGRAMDAELTELLFSGFYGSHANEHRVPCHSVLETSNTPVESGEQYDTELLLETPTAESRWCSADGIPSPEISHQIMPSTDEASHPGKTAAEFVRCWPLVDPCLGHEVAVFHDVDVLDALIGVHDKLLTLWELVILGEPLVVLAPTPSLCSSAVLALMGLVHPLPFAGDWRPYLCIQDPEYVRLASASCLKEALPRGAVYGVTSPLIISTISFPHILRITGRNDSRIRVTYKCGLKSSYKNRLQKSKQLSTVLSRARSAAKHEGRAARTTASNMVRTFFRKQITLPMLQPFHRYLGRSPVCGSVSAEQYRTDPFGRMPRLIKLDVDSFPTAVDLSAPGVHAMFRSSPIAKSRARSFYSAFVRTPVFQSWWRHAECQARRDILLVHRINVVSACASAERARPDAVPNADSCPEEEQKDLIDKVVRVQMELTAVERDDVEMHKKLMALLDTLKAKLTAESQKSIRDLL